MIRGDKSVLGLGFPGYAKMLRSVRVRFGVFIVLAVLGCVGDLATKKWVFDWLGLPPSETYWLIDGYVGIQTSLNPGALFGLGRGLGVVLVALAAVALAVIAGYATHVCRTLADWRPTVALGLMAAGTLGNLYDRLGLWAVPGRPEERITYVRDWILLKYGEHVWPNFNLADSCLVVGAVLLAWFSLTVPQPAKQHADGQPAVASGNVASATK